MHSAALSSLTGSCRLRFQSGNIPICVLNLGPSAHKLRQACNLQEMIRLPDSFRPRTKRCWYFIGLLRSQLHWLSIHERRFSISALAKADWSHLVAVKALREKPLQRSHSLQDLRVTHRLFQLPCSGAPEPKKIFGSCPVLLSVTRCFVYSLSILSCLLLKKYKCREGLRQPNLREIKQGLVGNDGTSVVPRTWGWVLPPPLDSFEPLLVVVCLVIT